MDYVPFLHLVDINDKSTYYDEQNIPKLNYEVGLELQIYGYKQIQDWKFCDAQIDYLIQ